MDNIIKYFVILQMYRLMNLKANRLLYFYCLNDYSFVVQIKIFQKLNS